MLDASERASEDTLYSVEAGHDGEVLAEGDRWTMVGMDDATADYRRVSVEWNVVSEVMHGVADEIGADYRSGLYPVDLPVSRD